MTKIPVSPSVYASGVAKFGEDKFGALFQINPYHCDHETFELQVERKRMDSSGPYQTRVTVYKNCLDCHRCLHGMEFWEAQRR